MEHGAFWFMDSSLFKNVEFYEDCLDNIKKEVSRSNEDFIKEHSEKYTYPSLPPVWKTLEVVSFGTLSKLFCLFKDNLLKKQVAREFGLPQYTYLESWIRCITVLRNCCAHHARIWNRRFALKPQLPNRLPPQMDYAKSKANQDVPSTVHLIIFGANNHALHGLEKFSAQTVHRIS